MAAAGSVPGSLARRLLARLIDGVVALVVGGGLLVGSVAAHESAGQAPLTGLALVGGGLLVAQAVVQWWLLATRGYSFGLLLTGLRLLETDRGTPIGWGRVLVHEVLVVLLGLVPVVGWVLLAVSVGSHPQRRGWHDRASGATVFDVGVGLDPAGGGTSSPRQATERLQALLGEGDRRRRRGAPERVAVEPFATERDPRPDESNQDDTSVLPPVRMEESITPGPRTRVVPPAPYEQVSNVSYRALDDEVERTRLRQARTKVAYAPSRAQSRPRATLLLWDNRVVVLEGTALVGRNPSPREGEALPVQVIAVIDRGRSVSKTHLAIGVDTEGVWLKDRNSTNGTVVTLEDGQQILCAPEQKVRVPVGASVAFGDYWLTVAG